jgi:hypothetical protein
MLSYKIYNTTAIKYNYNDNTVVVILLMLY